MRLVFLGTRGNIVGRSARHRRHTATTIAHRGVRLLIDCGADWLGRVASIAPTAIFLTHAHEDHAGGLARGAPCPVWATRATWSSLARAPIPPALRRRVTPRSPVRIGPFVVEAFRVEHSDRAPAVGYRIAAAGMAVFYVPDVLAIREPRAALRGVAAYVGDGATVVRPIVRRSVLSGRPIGHASIAVQLEWCRRQRVPRMIVTHCGSQLVGPRERAGLARIEELAAASGVAVAVATDGSGLRVAR